MNCTRYTKELEQLAQEGMLRQIPKIEGQGKWITLGENRLLNLSSNDYLGIFEKEELVSEFMAQFNAKLPRFSSASSRLLTGNNKASEELEKILANKYNKESALIFNSGYHANSGILAALAQKDSLIIADKLVHASLIDGIKLSGAPFERFRHNDIKHLRKIIEKEHCNYSQIFVVTEGIFSMGGDRGKIEEIIALKAEFENIIIYVDEAHSFGVCGDRGLGICEELGVLNEVDIIIGTFGKAISSVGAYAVMPSVVREYLVNKMRPLIFSTSLPPFNIEWSKFIIQNLSRFNEARKHLVEISSLLRSRLQITDSESQIITYTVGEASRAVALSKRLAERGFYALAVRPPTVPIGKSGIRFSLTASITTEEIEKLYTTIRELEN